MGKRISAETRQDILIQAIVRDKEAQPQVRINAVNSVFAGVKGLSKDNREVFAGMAVKIIDSI